MPNSPISAAIRPPLTIWRLTDGKPGHEKQTLGLANALGRLAECRRIDIAAPTRGASLVDWLRRRFPVADACPAPDLILAAGHGTHLAALAARRAHGGRVVVLMRPTLPLAWFDLCLIPEHDGAPMRANVWATRGVLNAVVPSDRHDAGLGVILIGGASPHYEWEDDAIVQQVRGILEGSPGIRWCLTDSRRTPATCLARLAAETAGLDIRPHTMTPPGWLEQALGEADRAWVTEDSVSMVYEALTAGCAVGLIRVPRRQSSRVGRGVERLVQGRWLTPFDVWRQTGTLARPPGRFDEADRCARGILELWFRRAG